MTSCAETPHEDTITEDIVTPSSVFTPSGTNLHLHMIEVIDSTKMLLECIRLRDFEGYRSVHTGPTPHWGVDSSMGTHTGSTSHWVDDSSMGSLTGSTSHWVDDSSMGPLTGPTQH